jgi:hypothetical protein
MLMVKVFQNDSNSSFVDFSFAAEEGRGAPETLPREFFALAFPPLFF